jgi:hypothetical protein
MGTQGDAVAEVEEVVAAEDMDGSGEGNATA